jgi:energy-converting hydrogenase Eha subunit F
MFIEKLMQLFGALFLLFQLFHVPMDRILNENILFPVPIPPQNQNHPIHDILDIIVNPIDVYIAA